jgi:diguanylate cyclase (GGDEF)-like protein
MRRPARFVWRAAFALLSVLAATGHATGAAAADEPTRLPLVLSTGWRAAEGDPPDGVAGIDRLEFRPSDVLADQAPREGVRWYRLLVDLSPFVGQPLAFASSGIRDVDEAWFDGVRIGGLGEFPPASDTAHFVSSLVLFLGASLVVAVLLVLFAFHARSPADYLLFAGFAAGLGLYVLTSHSVWSKAPVSPSAVFRASLSVLSATAICYCAAMLRFLGAGIPVGYRVLLPAFGLLGLLAPVVPGAESFVVPTLLFRWAFAALLVDLLVRFVVAAWRGRRSARTDLVGHAAFLVAAIPLAGLVPGSGPADLDPTWRVVLLGLLFMLLASVVLWRMSEEVRRYRLAGLTDAGTRLWNREALYEEIAERGEAVRRGKGAGFGLLLADLDRFREWNDARGHMAGDRVLLRAARALLDASRPQDFVARYGGDEFAVVVGAVDASSFPALAERLRDAVGAALEDETGGILATASVGTELVDGARHRTPEDLLREADRALFEAKQSVRPGPAVRIARQTPSGKWSLRI